MIFLGTKINNVKNDGQNVRPITDIIYFGQRGFFDLRRGKTASEEKARRRKGSTNGTRCRPIWPGWVEAWR